MTAPTPLAEVSADADRLAFVAAIDAAKGNLATVRRALGVSGVTVHARLNRYALRPWLAATWPQRGGHRAVDVLRVEVEHGAILSYHGAIRVYVLAAHGDVAAGEHRSMVPAVGVVRARVVCQQCREQREKSE